MIKIFSLILCFILFFATAGIIEGKALEQVSYRVHLVQLQGEYSRSWATQNLQWDLDDDDAPLFAFAPWESMESGKEALIEGQLMSSVSTLIVLGEQSSLSLEENSIGGKEEGLRFHLHMEPLELDEKGNVLSRISIHLSPQAINGEGICWLGEEMKPVWLFSLEEGEKGRSNKRLFALMIQACTGSFPMAQGAVLPALALPPMGNLAMETEVQGSLHQLSGLFGWDQEGRALQGSLGLHFQDNHHIKAKYSTLLHPLWYIQWQGAIGGEGLGVMARLQGSTNYKPYLALGLADTLSLSPNLDFYAGLFPLFYTGEGWSQEMVLSWVGIHYSQYPLEGGLEYRYRWPGHTLRGQFMFGFNRHLYLTSEMLWHGGEEVGIALGLTWKFPLPFLP